MYGNYLCKYIPSIVHEIVTYNRKILFKNLRRINDKKVYQPFIFEQV